MKSKRPLLIVIGAVVVVVAVVVAVFVSLSGTSTSQPDASPGSSKTVTVNVIGGSEKSELMADPEVQRILKESYGVEVNFTPMGSYAQVQLSPDELTSRGIDALWPSSASAESVFEASSKSSFPDYRAESVLQSPEVIYSGPKATDALLKAGIVQQVGEQYFVVDLKSLLLDYTLQGKQWEDIGAEGLFGPIKVGSTDPAKSNSGFTMSQLELNVVSTDNVFQAPNIEQAKQGLPIVRQLYDAQGLQASSSDFGFKEWLLQGAELRSPLYAGYENQLTQFWVHNKDNTSVQKQLTDNVRLLYPQPTIYNEHPVLALTSGGRQLIEAMKDPAVQKIAWEQYGFRSGTTIGVNDVSYFGELNLAQNLQVTNAPNAEVTLLLLGCLNDASRCAVN